jgi:hypothetical protein
MTRYLPLIFAGISCLLILLLSGREWRLARKLYGTQFWSAVRQMFACWLLTRRYQMLYAAIILLGAAVGPVLMGGYQLGPFDFAVILIFATVALHTISWNLLPPGVLFLASSDPISAPARSLVQATAKFRGFRVVYLLRGRMAGTLERLRSATGVIKPSDLDNIGFSMGNLRTANDAIWKEVLNNLIAMAPIIVLDTRLSTVGVSYELLHVLDAGFYRKTLFVISGEDTPNLAEQMIVDKLGPNANVHLLSPDDENLGYAVREHLWRQADISRGYGQPRHTRPISPTRFRTPVTIWSRIRLGSTACLGLLMGLLAYSALTTRVVVNEADSATDVHVSEAKAHGQSLLVIQPGGDVDKARRATGFSGGAMAGISCAMGISCLLSLRRAT